MQEFVELQQQWETASPPPPREDVAEVWSRHAFIPYRIGPADILSVALTGLTDATETIVVEARVDREGRIALPMVGDVKVGGLELVDADEIIKKTFVPAIVKDLTVKVDVSQYETTDVLVVGAVDQPGLIPLHRTQRYLLYAVAAAGGLTAEASGRITLRRVRRPDEEVTLNLLDPVELEAAFALEPLDAGDVVKVQAAVPNTIFVGGLVNAPGIQVFPQGTRVNLLQLLAAAGGVREDVFPKEATLIRRMPDGRDVQVKVDLDRLRNGKDPNVMLAAGDIFWVPETFGTMTMDFINRNIFFRAGFTANYTVSGNATGIEFLNRRRLQSARFDNNRGGTGGGTLQNLVDPLGFLIP